MGGAACQRMPYGGWHPVSGRNRPHRGFANRVGCAFLFGSMTVEDRPPSPRSRYDLYLTGKIHAIHRRSNGAYGSPMIHAELSDDHGIRVGCKRVARLMRAAHLQGVWPHRFVITTVRDEAT